MHMVLKTHIMQIKELKLLINKLSGRGEALMKPTESHSWGLKAVLMTQEPGTDLALNGHFIRGLRGTTLCMHTVTKL